MRSDITKSLRHKNMRQGMDTLTAHEYATGHALSTVHRASPQPRRSLLPRARAHAARFSASPLLTATGEPLRLSRL